MIVALGRVEDSSSGCAAYVIAEVVVDDGVLTAASQYTLRMGRI